MKLILPQGVADFDTLGAMVGAFLLDADTILLAPERFSKECEPLVRQYLHKLPLVSRKVWLHPDGKQWKLPLWDRFLMGVEFLQSLKIAGWLREKNARLDPWYASVILLGIYASSNHLDSFSVDDEVHRAIDYLVAQGADEDFVQDWLSGRQHPLPALPARQRMPLATVYEARMPAWQQALTRVIYEHAWALGMNSYLVGGVTRDLLLGRPIRDMDFIVEGSAPLLAKTLAAAFGGEMVTHTVFGTARWDLQEAAPAIAAASPLLTEAEAGLFPESIDLISARTEWYPAEGQLPKVRMDSIELDLQRRDFSISTLALKIEPQGYTLIDVCGGLPDLDRRVIRALHPRSFIDDPTRLFRAVRYEQRMGFTIEEQTLDWMQPGLAAMQVVSGDRIRYEFNLIMAEAAFWAMFKRIEQLGILHAAHPFWHPLKEEWQAQLRTVLHEPLPDGWKIAEKFDHLTSRELMGYAVLFQEMSAAEVCSIGERLLFSGSQIRQFCELIGLLLQKETLKALSAGEFTLRMEGLHPALLYVLLVLWQQDSELREKILQLQHHWRHVRPALNGHHLQKMGIPTGPLYAKLLNALRVARINGEIQTETEEIARVHQLLREWGERGDG